MRWKPSRQGSGLLVALGRVIFGFLVLLLILGAVHFPLDTDSTLTDREIEATKKYYAESYKALPMEKPATEYETKYIEVATAEAHAAGIENNVRAFVDRYDLGNKAVLEIGSGRGYLQDVVENYTGLDISSTVARFYHKRFVLGSATAMPFVDNTFDAVWSIWVFEHVPNPEQAFREARRVTRAGGYLYIQPAFMASSWAAEGYEVRPYSDFDFLGKVIKATVPLRGWGPFQAMTLLPIRAVRSVVAAFGPTNLRYRRLTPNYDTYWVQDADAMASIDSHEALLWFQSRGDECLNCKGARLLMGFGPLILKVNK